MKGSHGSTIAFGFREIETKGHECTFVKIDISPNFFSSPATQIKRRESRRERSTPKGGGLMLIWKQNANIIKEQRGDGVATEL